VRNVGRAAAGEAASGIVHGRSGIAGRLKYVEVGLDVRRITLNLLPGLEVEFVDRDRALAQVVEWAEKSTRWPVVVFGPEGCGKTAFLRQAAEALGELGYDVFYIDPLHRFFTAHTDVGEVVRRLAEAASEAFGIAQLKLATLALDVGRELLERWGRRRVAVLRGRGVPGRRAGQGGHIREEPPEPDRVPAEELRGDSGRGRHQRGADEGGNRPP